MKTRHVHVAALTAAAALAFVACIAEPPKPVAAPVATVAVDVVDAAAPPVRPVEHPDAASPEANAGPRCFSLGVREGEAASSDGSVVDTSAHRGSWSAIGFDRWRSAVEGYASMVAPGNQTSLGTAGAPFAFYLSGMHKRVHPLFADGFLASLDGLPCTSPLNDPRLVTRVEIVLEKDGRIQKMGILRSSGLTAFDVAVLDSFFRAQPFGPAPAPILSTDGRVYLHWDFHRDPTLSCSTINVHPFLLNIPAAP
ncbi:MAG TPA: TonB C-terminal domain-containing protein [Polyangiaceae bacterium]|jgi:TonB family protein